MSRQLQLQNQAPLGISRLATLVLTGVRFRLLRSTVTLAVIAVAVAFVVSIAVGDLTLRRASERAAQEVAHLRMASVYATYLTRSTSVVDIISHLATRRWVPGLDADLQSFSGIGPDTLQEFYTEVPQRLQNRGGVRDRGAGRTVEGNQDRWIALLEATSRGHDAAAERLRVSLDARGLLEAAANNPDGAAKTVRNAGFTIEPKVWNEFVERAHNEHLVANIETRLLQRPLRQALAAQLQMAPERIGTLEADRFFATAARVRALNAALLQAHPGEKPLDAEQVAAAFSERLRLRARQETVDRAAGTTSEGHEFSVRSWLLMGMALLVAVVGVANALIMSVIERFREIATLKCLGALDGTILGMFLLEAAVTGFVGALAGGFIGTVVAMLKLAFTGGWWVALSLPGASVLMVVSGAAAMGMLLAVMGAVYPALKAARLPPMEAMRIE
ncbi:MAG: ABC transporter permease [Acidobacteriaceae bacterium]